MLTLSPVAIGSSVARVTIPAQAKLLKIVNSSQYGLQLQLGGLVDWLPPWVANVYPCSGVTTLQVTPSLLGAPEAAPSSSLLITIGFQGDSFEGSYPCSLPNPALAVESTSTIVYSTNLAAPNPLSQDVGAPAGTTQVVFASTAGAPTLKVTGDQTGTVYLNAVAPGTYAAVITDSSCTLLFAGTFGLPPGSTTVTFKTSPLTQPVSDSSNNAFTIGQKAMAASLPVTIASDQSVLPLGNLSTSPPAWQWPNQPLIAVNTTLAGAATATLKAAVGGQRIYLFGVAWDFDAAVAGVGFGLQDSAGTPAVFHTSDSTVATGRSAYHAGAIGPGVGLALVLKNFSASSVTARGSVSVSQAA